MSYKHLCPEERHYIEIELKNGTSLNKITESLGEAKAVFRVSLAETEVKEGAGISRPRVLPRNVIKTSPKRLN